MAFDDKSLDGYIYVAQRIADFRELYKEGSLQPADPAAPYHIMRVPSGWCRKCTGARTVKINYKWQSCPRCEGTGLRGEGEPTEDTFIVYTAAAYRTPHDQRPGIGVAWEAFPGQTPYTAGSELMNAETSAQGRAIVAALASDSKRGVASREEIRNRRAEQDGGTEDEPPRSRAEQGPRPLAELPRNAKGQIKQTECTDEELEAAGFLTGERKTEHNALRKGTAGKLTDADAEKRKACSPENPCNEADCPNCTPQADLWTEPPPGPPLRKPKAARPLPEQIATYFTTLGINDRDVRLGYTMRIAGTGRLSSSKDLTASQARKVIDVLSKCRDLAALHEYLDANQEATSDA